MNQINFEATTADIQEQVGIDIAKKLISSMEEIVCNEHVRDSESHMSTVGSMETKIAMLKLHIDNPIDNKRVIEILGDVERVLESYKSSPASEGNNVVTNKLTNMFNSLYTDEYSVLSKLYNKLKEYDAITNNEIVVSSSRLDEIAGMYLLLMNPTRTLYVGFDNGEKMKVSLEVLSKKFSDTVLSEDCSLTTKVRYLNLPNGSLIGIVPTIDSTKTIVSEKVASPDLKDIINYLPLDNLNTNTMSIEPDKILDILDNQECLDRIDEILYIVNTKSNINAILTVCDLVLVEFIGKLYIGYQKDDYNFKNMEFDLEYSINISPNRAMYIRPNIKLSDTFPLCKLDMKHDMLRMLYKESKPPLLSRHEQVFVGDLQRKLSKQIPKELVMDSMRYGTLGHNIQKTIGLAEVTELGIGKDLYRRLREGSLSMTRGAE